MSQAVHRCWQRNTKMIKCWQRNVWLIKCWQQHSMIKNADSTMWWPARTVGSPDPLRKVNVRVPSLNVSTRGGAKHGTQQHIVVATAYPMGTVTCQYHFLSAIVIGSSTYPFTSQTGHIFNSSGYLGGQKHSAMYSDWIKVFGDYQSTWHTIAVQGCSTPTHYWPHSDPILTHCAPLTARYR